jgi:hypothetical protein
MLTRTTMARNKRSTLKDGERNESMPTSHDKKTTPKKAECKKTPRVKQKRKRDDNGKLGPPGKANKKVRAPHRNTRFPKNKDKVLKPKPRKKFSQCHWILKGLGAVVEKLQTLELESETDEDTKAQAPEPSPPSLHSKSHGTSTRLLGGSHQREYGRAAQAVNNEELGGQIEHAGDHASGLGQRIRGKYTLFPSAFIN